jgi:YVTN family beta-propeller protein
MKFTRLVIFLLAGVSTSLAAAPFAYVPNEGSGTISIIDTQTDAVTGEIAIGGKPRGIAISPDGKRLYVSEQKGEHVDVIDTATKKFIKKIPVGDSPEAVYVNQDGTLIAVANEEANTVSLIDTKALRIKSTIKLSGKNPEHAVFSPDGKLIFASAEEADKVDVVSVEKKKQIARIDVLEALHLHQMVKKHLWPVSLSTPCMQ